MNLVKEAEAATDEAGIITFDGPLHKQDRAFSYWKPSPIDMLRLMRGRPIRIGAFGATPARISIDTEE